MKKLIGVTPRISQNGDIEREGVNRNYIEALQKRDANVIMITINNPNLKEILDLCDGFLVTGGNDMDPKYYGEVNEGLSKGVREEHDIIDKEIIEYAVKNKKPLLGICRGHQSINVILGGTLIQDIGTSHSNISNGETANTIENDVLNFEKVITTNSYHHQAIGKIAPNMKVIATHPDGTVEAIVHDFLPIIGIQWHPERLQDSEPSKIIFDKFFDFLNNSK